MSSARPPVISLLLRSARVGGVALGILASLGASAVHAVEIGSTEAATVTPARTAPSSSALSQTTTATSMWSGNDAALAQLWSLTLPEVQRARVLMQGPRGAFSSPQLSPIEALGIHARTDAERDRYARLFAINARAFAGCCLHSRSALSSSGTTIVASDSMTNIGVFSVSLSQVIFSFGVAPEYDP